MRLLEVMFDSMFVDEPISSSYRSGFVAMIGRPNVGKSTLVNYLVGEKVAITSPVAQTTRTRLRAILTTSNAQVVIVDTPGIHKPHHLLGERLVKSARSAIGEVDIVLLLLEACHPPGRGDSFIVQLLKNQTKPVLVALNKSDLVSEAEYLERENSYRNLFGDSVWPIYRCSAFNGEGCQELVRSLVSLLPLGPQLYPPEMVSDQPDKVVIGELIREQILSQTKEEVPHSVAVMIDRIEEITSGNKIKKGKSNTAILATILVERKSQKGILIGKGGAMLKKIGQASRLQIQEMINGPVYLELFVKVVPNWRSKPARLSELGYEVN